MSGLLVTTAGQALYGTLVAAGLGGPHTEMSIAAIEAEARAAAVAPKFTDMDLAYEAGLEDGRAAVAPLEKALREIAEPREVAGECIWCMTDQGHAADPDCPVTIAARALLSAPSPVREPCLNCNDTGFYMLDGARRPCLWDHMSPVREPEDWQPDLAALGVDLSTFDRRTAHPSVREPEGLDVARLAEAFDRAENPSLNPGRGWPAIGPAGRRLAVRDIAREYARLTPERPAEPGHCEIAGCILPPRHTGGHTSGTFDSFISPAPERPADEVDG